MHATARRHHHHGAPATPPRPHLRPVPATARRRLPSAASVALYAIGLTAGFLLAALASTPGGAGIVAGQLQLAAIGAVVAVVALGRARAVARGPRTAGGGARR